MIIETKFSPGQIVFIPEAGFQRCRIVAVKLSGLNLFYEVEYWLGDGVRSATLFEDELVAAVPEGQAGFRGASNG
jgi:hypothetical protein